MLSKSKITFVRSLQLRKYRQKYHKIVVEGTKIISDIIHESLVAIDAIYATEEWIASHDELLRFTRGEVTIVTQSDLSKVSGFKTPQAVLAVCNPPTYTIEPDLPKKQVCLYLDGIRDPGNLGTILRIADWFGFDTVYMSSDCVDVFNPKVIQASMSSVFRVRSMSCALADLDDIGTIPVLCATLEGTSIDEMDAPSKGLIVLGNEAHGIRPESREYCTQEIAISSQNSLGAESLNVAAAAAVICAYFSGPNA